MDRADLLTSQRVEEGKAQSGKRDWGFSWVIALLVLSCWMVDFIDRQSLSVLVRFLPPHLKMSNVVYAHITSALLMANAATKPLAGWLLDLVGLRIGLTVSVVLWSVLQFLCGTARSITGLGTFRFLIGIPEAANMPSASKIAAEHAAPHARATLVGFAFFGGTIGTALAFPIAAFISLRFGWSWAFYATGLLGFVWVPFWLIFYRPKPRTAASSGTPEVKVPWVKLLLDKRVLSLNCAQVFAGASWWFYFFWIPPFLVQVRHLNIRELGTYGWVPELFACLGPLVGGYTSDSLVRRGWEPLKARKTIIWIAASIVPFSALVVKVNNLAACLTILAMATFFTSCFVTNVFAMPADAFNHNRVASVAGLNAMWNNLGAIAAMELTGYVVERFSYTPVLIVVAFLLPVGALCAQRVALPKTAVAL